jgi:hypothetical protein
MYALILLQDCILKGYGSNLEQVYSILAVWFFLVPHVRYREVDHKRLFSYPNAFAIYINFLQNIAVGWLAF